MAEINKVETADGEVLIDLTADTVSEKDVNEGVTFHGADGVARTGTAPDKMPYISGRTPILLTDTEEAYSKETVFPYAAVNSIGGKSVVWNQIAKNSPFSSRDGITTSTDGDYSVYNGTASHTNSAGGWYGLSATDGINIVGHKVFTQAKIISGSYNGTAKFGVINQTVNVGEMLITGITSDSYSTTGNLSNFSWGIDTTFDNLKLHIIFVDLTAMFGAGNEPTTTDDPRIAWIEAYAEAHPEYNTGEIISAEVDRIITNSADGLIYPIPEAIRQLDGYGWSAGNVYNEVDYEGRKYIQRVGRVDLGTLDWTYEVTNKQFWAAQNSIARSEDYRFQMLCAKYEIGTNHNILTDKQITGYIKSNWYLGQNWIYVKDLSYTLASDFTSAMSGVYLYYELAEPIITDISNIITDDFLIECESGGSITFESESKLGVPNAVEYITEADFAKRKANKIDVLKVDDELSETSENPVQNKVITAALQNLPTGGLNFGTVSYEGTGTDVREIEFPVDIKLYSVSAYIPSSGNCFTTGIIPANSPVCVTPYWGERYSGVVGCNAEYHDQKLIFTRITGDTATNHNYPGEEVTVSYWY